MGRKKKYQGKLSVPQDNQHIISAIDQIALSSEEDAKISTGLKNDGSYFVSVVKDVRGFCSGLMDKVHKRLHPEIRTCYHCEEKGHKQHACPNRKLPGDIILRHSNPRVNPNPPSGALHKEPASGSKEEPASGSKVHIVGLAPTSLDSELKALFKPFGDILSVEIQKKLGTELCDGHGYVTFAKAEHAINAVKGMQNSYKYGGEALVVEIAPPN